LATTISSVNSTRNIRFGTYFVIVTCRNSEDTIRNALVSIKHQTVNPAYVIVVNDGSKDKTKESLEDMQKDWPLLYVINIPDLGYDISRVVNNWNAAIKFARESGLPKTDYHMIATDDTIYPVYYAQKIISSMDSNQSLAIASGNYAKYEALTPHGAGRFIRNSFFEKTIWQGQYPQQMGYESAILYEARRSGYSYVIIKNAKFAHTKPLGETHKFYEFGASMRTLGYHPICVLARFLKCFITGKFTGRKGALCMLYYYLTYSTKSGGYNQLYDESMRNYVRANQLLRLRRIIYKLNNRAPSN
jgi:glycosyltransferase involved in cell wall biosynthesis